MAALSGGHLATDFASGRVPALLPFFTAKFDLSYTLTAVLMLAVLRLLVAPAAPFRALVGPARCALAATRPVSRWPGSALGLAAVAPSYWLLLVLVFVSGVGIAAFHPEGAKSAVFASGRKRASGMSLFNIGGNTGYALGPIVVTPLVLWLGLGPGGLLASIPVLLAALAVLAVLPYLGRLRARSGEREARRGGPRRRTRDDSPRRRDRAPERRVVRPSHVPAAVGRVARQLGGRREPSAVADASRRCRGHTAPRAGRATGSGSGARSWSPRRS